MDSHRSKGQILLGLLLAYGGVLGLSRNSLDIVLRNGFSVVLSASLQNEDDDAGICA